VKQTAEDRALYLRQLRATIRGTFLPELTSARARDAAELADRVVAELVVDEEFGDTLSGEFGREFARLLRLRVTAAPVTPERFHELRRQSAERVATGAGSEDAAERTLCRQLVDVEHRFLERVDELRCAVLNETHESGVAGSDSECSITPDRLTRYLRGKLPHSPGLTVMRLEVIPGGRSKETILASLSETDALPPEVIVRKDRPVGVLRTRAADEFAILQAVHAHGGVPVAEPFFADDSSPGLSDDAGTVVVMARVPGTKAGEFFPDLAAPPLQDRRAIGTQLAAALAHLHALPLDDLKETNLDTEVTVTAATVVGSVEAMVSRMEELSGPPIAAVPLARRWLVDHVDDVVPAGRLCLLQGDVGLHNLLVDGDRVSALVDWEAATIGPPARELAAAWPAATALMGWPAFADAYIAAGGAADATDPAAVTYYRLFIALGACMSSRTGLDLFRTGAKRDLVTAHSGLDAHFRAQRNLARALADALGDR
jgi:aminoglycoside phosphotransferase (APT) family kinase protein